MKQFSTCKIFSCIKLFGILVIVSCGQPKIKFTKHNQFSIQDPIQKEADLTAAKSWTWWAGKPQLKETSIDTGFGAIEQNISLVKGSPSFEVKQQISRPILTESFTQGFYSNDDMTQNFSVKEAGLFDLLIVMDNSGTMKSFQSQLGARMVNLLNDIENTNWQITVVTTDNPCLRETSGTNKVNRVDRSQFENNQAQAILDYQDLIQIKDTGNPVERGIKMSVEALTNGCEAPGATYPSPTLDQDWKRAGAKTAVLIVTDEKNCGSGALGEARTEDNPNGANGCDGSPWQNSTYLTENADIPDDTAVYGLFLLEDNPACEDSGGYTDQYPSEYIKLVEDTGGQYTEICQSDYSELLSIISQDVKDTITLRFPLNFEPDINSISVTVDGVEVTEDWQYDSEDNLITISATRVQDATGVTIDYKHEIIPIRSTFALPEDTSIDPETVEVKINGTSIPKAQWEWQNIDKKISFTEQPPLSSNIDVTFRKNDNLPRTFYILGEYRSGGDVGAAVNGSQVEIESVDGDLKQVTLVTAPRDEELLTITFEKLGDRVTSYPLDSVEYDRVEKIDAYDTKTGDFIPVELRENLAIFNPEDVSNDRDVTVRYKYSFDENQRSFEVTLAHKPDTGSLMILADKDAKTCFDSHTVKPDEENGMFKLNFTCESDDMSKIKVSYSWIKGYQNIFEVPGILEQDAEFQVYIDDNITEDFILEGNTLVIPKTSLPPGAKIQCNYIPKKEI